jgi:triosephosphate isomerase
MLALWRMRRPLVAGNWKQNASRKATAELLAGLRARLGTSLAAEVLVCPPFVYLTDAADALRGSAIGLGAQTLSVATGGAFTGEISGTMLRDVGCTYVIVGHSERRTLYGETDEVVAAKFAAACTAGLRPILCVGETLAEREAGVTSGVVERQLRAVIDRADQHALASCVVAYEPVWAIGTGRNATAAQAQEVHQLLRALLATRDATIAASVRILYGGSVKGSNAGALFAMPDIDGGLVGGASLDAADFTAICQAAGV